MDQSVRNLLNKKMKLGGQELNVSDVLLLAAITVLAVWVRTAVRSFVAQDWTDYWSLWLELSLIHILSQFVTARGE